MKAGKEIVVLQPTCGYVLKNEYPDFLDTDDARLVAADTNDISEYLMARHRIQPLDTDFGGEHLRRHHLARRLPQRAQQIGPKSRDLMALTGAKVTMVERCSAIDGTWGLRAENVEMARKIAKPLMETLAKADAELIAGDCHLANTAIEEGTGPPARAPDPGAGPGLRHRRGRDGSTCASSTLADIADHRDYERERDEFRAEVIAMKKRRRIPLGDIITLVFENTTTMRFQVQEMARAERMLADEQIDRKSPPTTRSSPAPGELSATLFIELTTRAARRWLPSSSASRTMHRVRGAGDAVVRGLSRRPGAADPRGHDHHDGPLPEVPLRRPRPVVRSPTGRRGWSSIIRNTRLTRR